MLTLIAAASIVTALDAERAFARDAQRLGQWTAFRKWADSDAVMFTPQAIWAHEFLRGKKNPAVSVTWRAAVSIVSCDGKMAVNTGPSERNAGKLVGYFTTVWSRDSGRWRWLYDNGDVLQKPMAVGRQPKVLRASCRGRPTGAPLMATPTARRRAPGVPPDDFGRGRSADGTLGWDWKVEPSGAQKFRVFLWDGARYGQVLYNDVKAQAKVGG